jgi:MFS family permease
MTAPAGQKPSRVRFGVLGFACALSMITYLDRACFPNAQEPIRYALGLNSIADLTIALTAFNLAYALFEVPTGYLGDRFGTRKTLIRIVLWWSFFTVLSGLAGLRIAGVVLVGLTVLVVVRFLFGIGEAGAYPNLSKVIYTWFPYHERGRASGLVWMSARGMGGLTPLIWMLLTVHFGLQWNVVFAVFGALGVVWCISFAWWFRERPEDHPAVNVAERDYIRGSAGEPQFHSGVPWGKLLRSRSIWALCLMYFCASYGWYFNLNYLPAYLEEQHGVLKDSEIGALYKGGPLLFGMVGCLIGGWLTDLYIRRTGDRRTGRRICGLLGHGACAICYVFCLIAPSAPTFALAIAMAGFTNDLTMGSAWAACQDIGKRYAGIVSGMMNTVGNLGGALSTFLTGTIIGHSLDAYMRQEGISKEAMDALRTVAKTDPAEKANLLGILRAGQLHGYETNLIIYGCVFVVAAFLWLAVDATKPIESTAPARH